MTFVTKTFVISSISSPLLMLISITLIVKQFAQLLGKRQLLFLKQWENLEIILRIIKIALGTSLAVQWLRLCTSTAGGMGSIPDWRTKIPRAARHGQKKKLYLRERYSI